MRQFVRLARVTMVLAVVLLLAPPPARTMEPYRRGAGAPLTVGVHAPNRDWREGDFALVAVGEFGGVKLMSYHPPAVYERLHRLSPDMQFVVRLNTNWHELPTPEQFAGTHVPYLQRLVEAGIEPWVEIANEPNLELHPYAEHTFATWYAEALRRLRAAVPQARYGFPGLAQDLREEAWWEANATAIQESDWLGVHAYWINEREMLDPKQGLKVTQVHRRFPEKPLVVTEAGNTAYDVARATKGQQYARYSRTLAQLPYVQGLYFFILYGTREWTRFFFDDAMALAVRDAAREPVPPLLALFGMRPRPAKQWRAASPNGAGTGAALPAPVPAPAPQPTVAPTPEPEGFRRRRLLVDTQPTPGKGERWMGLPADSPLAPRLRTVNGYTVTDASAQLSIAPPQPGIPLAVQFAETNLFGAIRGGDLASSAGPATSGTGLIDGPVDGPVEAPAGGAVGGAGGTSARGIAGAPTRPTGGSGAGVALLWDGATWRLQYHRGGKLSIDQPLADAPPGQVPPGGTAFSGTTVETRLVSGADAAEPAQAIWAVDRPTMPLAEDVPNGGWLRVEIALEPRSAAAWVWRRGEPQPAAPNAVFALPEEALRDGARLRALFLPAHPTEQVILEGATRYE